MLPNCGTLTAATSSMYGCCGAVSSTVVIIVDGRNANGHTDEPGIALKRDVLAGKMFAFAFSSDLYELCSFSFVFRIRRTVFIYRYDYLYVILVGGG